MTTPGLALSVIVPAYRCSDMLRASLAGLQASDLRRAEWELIVVDDGSADETADVARSVADRVITISGGPRGPANARNLGAVFARASILLFVDSDVVVAPSTLSGFVRAFRDQPDVTAVFGAHDESPRDERFVSQYRNLLHHYVHSVNAGDAVTFWAGCGAVRREEFFAIGGYDERRYPRPQIEDIELGYRLSSSGRRIVLAPELQGTHLKSWTLTNMLRTDFRERAVPWMHLLLERGESITDGPLNLQSRDKVMTLLSVAVVLSALLGLLTHDARWLLISALAVIAVIAGNRAMFRWFASVRGWNFAVRVVPMRLLFYWTSGLGALWAILSHLDHPRFESRVPLKRADDSSLAA